MNDKVLFPLSLLVIALLHVYILSTINVKPVVVKVQNKVSPIINMQHVVIKEPEPIVEPVVEEVVPEPPEPVVEEVIVPPKKIKKKAIKKVVKKKVVKKKKVKKKKVKKKNVKKKKVLKKRTARQASSPQQKSIKNAYLSKIRRSIERRKKYPKSAKRAKQQGTVRVRFTINANGSIRNISLVGGTPYAKLNKAAFKILRRIGSFAPIPKELGKRSLTVTVPIRYKILN